MRTRSRTRSSAIAKSRSFRCSGSRSMSIDDKRRYASAAFVTLLVLSVFWPSPVVSTNQLWLDHDLSVDDLSFLGREAPSWDVAFWCLAGLLLLAIAQSADGRDIGETWRTLRAMRFA